MSLSFTRMSVWLKNFLRRDLIFVCLIGFIGCESKLDVPPIVPKPAVKTNDSNARISVPAPLESIPPKSIDDNDISLGDNAPNDNLPDDISPDVSDLVDQAGRALAGGKVEEAWQSVQQALLSEPDNASALFLAGRIVAAQGDLYAAIDFLNAIGTKDPQIELAVAGQTAQWMMEQGRLIEAEPRLLKVLKTAPDNPIVNRLLLRICNAEGRRFESETYTRNVIRTGQFQLSDLAMLCSIETQFRDERLHELMQNVTSEQSYLLTYNARESLIYHKYDEASELLRKAVEIDPSNREAWVWQGTTFAMQDAWELLPAWLEHAPVDYQKHPQFWNVMGLWLEHQDELPQAVQAFRNTLELDMRSLTATEGISRLLILLGQRELGEGFRQRSFAIGRTNELTRDVLRQKFDRQTCAKLAKDYKTLGLNFLAKQWELVSKTLPLKADSADAVDNPVTPDEESQASSESMLLVDLFAALDKLNFAPIDLQTLPTLDAQQQTQKLASFDASIQFQNVALEMGLTQADFDCGFNTENPDMYSYQVMGGGIAALDYQLDGFVDLYFARAGGIPSDPSSNKAKSLYRNLYGQAFDLISDAMIDDRGYGQGLAVGDTDQDGFPDLLVNNIGQCRLYHNNGDGTFSLEKDIPLNNDTRWTAAAAIGDINRDNLPDIYIATYYGGDAYETQRCPHPVWTSTGCSPNTFPTSKDIVLINKDNHQWESADQLLQGTLVDGRSMGVVIGDLNQAVGNEIYVSNDTTANQIFINQLDEAGQTALMQTSGPSGVAVDINGRAQGSMGLSIADFDRNGMEDIFVTNANGEYNNAYLQIAKDLYLDRTRKLNLFQSALEMVSFGCQVHDFDNDGWPDIAVLNGNVDDRRYKNEMFEMPPSLYRNIRGTMELLPSETVGEYFTQATLGRSLATLDFDNDRKWDLIGSHLNGPPALLRNTCINQNHFIEMELIGVSVDRDAVGARVIIKSGHESWVDSVVVGEGYYSSNEKAIAIGLGGVAKIDRANVVWPDGSEQDLGEIAVDQRYVVVQGQPIYKR